MKKIIRWLKMLFKREKASYTIEEDALKIVDECKSVFHNNSVEMSRIRHRISYNAKIDENDISQMEAILKKEIEKLNILTKIIEKEFWEIAYGRKDRISEPIIEAQKLFHDRKGAHKLKIGNGYTPHYCDCENENCRNRIRPLLVKYCFISYLSINSMKAAIANTYLKLH